ncbi:hypothetical protein OKW21_003546 [Catalinimonas alkaloidigena]|uniref:hypothetical protein n=1 Tax=Catalinimonas alkaloidigena TaxID=1075417 RepID=UPI002404D8E7|nr:hypothetical protein [Catalinimonas alkaloidigena]MDF9798283.1 hypothetical protein [Catalinimonas alkaloidigena]
MRRSLVLATVTFVLISWCYAQKGEVQSDDTPVAKNASPKTLTKADSLKFTKNKTIPDIIRDEAIAALSHYPELAETPIDFVFRKDIIKSFMQAQPKWYGIFQGKKRRKYVVKITPALKLKDKSIPVEELPTEALIGWLGHELGHIMDYKNRSGFALIRFGIGYLTSEKYLKKAEQRADMYAINHQLGSEILSTKHFILENAQIPLAYKERIRRLYMSPEEVMEHIDEDGSLLPIEGDEL